MLIALLGLSIPSNPGGSDREIPEVLIVALINHHRRNHRAAIPEVLIARSGSLRPLEALSPLREGPDEGGAHETRHILDEDIEALVADELYKPESIWRLGDLQVSCGTLGLSTAFVKLIDANGMEHVACSVGTGPVDSAYKAMTVDYYYMVLFLPSLLVFLASVTYLVAGPGGANCAGVLRCSISKGE